MTCVCAWRTVGSEGRVILRSPHPSCRKRTVLVVLFVLAGFEFSIILITLLVFAVCICHRRRRRRRREFRMHLDL